MAIPTKRNNSSTSSSKTSSTKTFVGFGSKDKASKNNFGNTLARILLFIPNQIINITCFFLRGRGRGLLGLGVFIWGLVISSDAYWQAANPGAPADRKSTRLNSSHANISYAVFCLKKKKN